jgi:hypothetical protein
MTQSLCHLLLKADEIEHAFQSWISLPIDGNQHRAPFQQKIEKVPCIPSEHGTANTS